MSIVSSEISAYGNNPITTEDVISCAAKLGFHVKSEELDAHRVLLAAAFETFEELTALPDYKPQVTKPRGRREDIRQVKPDSNEFGNAWSYRCTLEEDAPDVSNPDKAALLLGGKNIVLKDNICVAGVPQVYGTDVIDPWVPSCDATVVSRIIEAGGCIVGTATCEALSCATVSNTAAAGPVFNPWTKDPYSAGGSSSGVGALVGNPMDESKQIRVDMGLGGDQGGSIRVPAAFCGLVGLKPTHGLVPYTGVAACEPIMDHVGPMCKTVWDVALLLEAVAGCDGVDDRQIGAQQHGAIKYSSDLKNWYTASCSRWPSKPLSRRKIAILSEALHAPFVKEEIKEELRRTARRYEDLGAHVEEISAPWHETGRSLWMAICRQSLTSIAVGNPMGRRGYYPTGFFEKLLPWSQEKWDRLPAAMRNELINGIFERDRYPTLYAKCMNLALQLREDYERFFEVWDVLLLPTVPFTAPPLFDREKASVWETMSSTFGQTLNTLQFNLTGHPAMSVPTGLRVDMSGISPDTKLPVGVQLVGPLHAENTVLEFGYALEQSYDWKAAT
ncbi:putative Amidase domain-containing protein [Seiridium cardinale]|uniref:Amidase domain-containing protein n=1 Tax=Seiridium cardinale TaxID=138064 RepID=A0ABR2XAJ4_9PEZI